MRIALFGFKGKYYGKFDVITYTYISKLRGKQNPALFPCTAIGSVTRSSVRRRLVDRSYHKGGTVTLPYSQQQLLSLVFDNKNIFIHTFVFVLYVFPNM